MHPAAKPRMSPALCSPSWCANLLEAGAVALAAPGDRRHLGQAQ